MAAGGFSTRQSCITNTSTPTIGSNKTNSLPNSSSPASQPKGALAPVGKLQFCLLAWNQITSDPWVLEVVNGYAGTDTTPDWPSVIKGKFLGRKSGNAGRNSGSAREAGHSRG